VALGKRWRRNAASENSGGALGAEANQYRKAKRRIWRGVSAASAKISENRKGRHQPKKESAKAAASGRIMADGENIASVAYASWQSAGAGIGIIEANGGCRRKHRNGGGVARRRKLKAEAKSGVACFGWQSSKRRRISGSIGGVKKRRKACI
jgi:hypothetical protein